MLYNTSNQPSKLGTKHFVGINYNSRGTFNPGRSSIKLKTSMFKSSLCDYSDAYILLHGTITSNGRGTDAAARQADKKDSGVIITNWPPSAKCMSKINYVNLINFT